MSRFTLVAQALSLFMTCALVSGQDPPKEKPRIEVGKPAPDFTLKDQDGKPVKLSGFRGKKSVLIAFYPKDFTGG